MASGILLGVVTWEFKLEGKNNAINMAFFMTFFAISLKAAISVPSNRIARFLYLYSDI